MHLAGGLSQVRTPTVWLQSPGDTKVRSIFSEMRLLCRPPTTMDTMCSLPLAEVRSTQSRCLWGRPSGGPKGESPRHCSQLPSLASGPFLVLLSPGSLCSPRDRPMNLRRGAEARKKLSSGSQQTKKMAEVWMPGCFIDQRERSKEELKSKGRRRGRFSGEVK